MTGTERIQADAAAGTAESRRTDALQMLQVVREQPGALFDIWSRLAARLTGASMAFISLGDAEHHFLKGRFDWPSGDGDAGALALGDMVRRGELPAGVGDAQTDPALARAGFVTGPPGIRWCAGAAIRSPCGALVGAICVADRRPRAAPSADQQAALADVAALVVQQLDSARRTRARLTDFIETGSDWLWETDAEHRFSHFLELHDIFVDDSSTLDIGKRRWELPGVDPSDARWAKHIADLDAHRPFRNFEYSTHDVRGGKHYLRVSGKPIFDDDGTFLGYRGTATDITEQKRGAQQLSESENRFRQIADSVPGIIWLTDAEGRLTFLNRAFEEYTGKAAGPYLGMTTTGSAHPEDAAGMTPLYQSAAQAHQRLTYEYRVRRRDGRYRWFLDTCVPRFDDSGRFLGYIGMLTDVHEMRQLSEQLHQAQKMQAVGQLTGGVAHDFNNLLTVILGNSELLAERLTAPELHRLADATRSAAERSAALVQRLLAFSRRQTLQPTIVDVSELVRGMRGLLAGALGESVEIGFSFAPDQWPAIVDRSQFEDAIVNLALNARDAMPEGGRMTIETANIEIDDIDVANRLEVLPGHYVLVAVSDDGDGMADEVRRHAFEPFYTTKDVGKGSGLGLSMVYGFIKQSGGQVTLHSEIGQGTTVKIYLPRAREQADAAATEETGTTAVSGAETILLVEDDERVRVYVAEQLSALGYRVVQAANGLEALIALDRTQEVALLFTDVVIPGGLNGRQLADEALRRRPALKVLFTSGYTENAIVHHGRLEQGGDLLGKPFSRAALAGKVRAVLDKTR